MKNKKVVIILLSLIILIGGILFENQIYNKPKNKHIPKKNNLAIMVKSESGDYVSTDAIPKGNYILNEEKTICENNGKVLNYDSTTGKVSFSFLGSDRCSLYFDKIIDTEKPVINNLTVNDTTIIATLTDNIELSGYGISTSNSVEPSSWTSISGTSYNLSTTITTEGTYYLWVKDSSGNKTISDVIDLEKKGYQTIIINNGGGATTVDAAKSYISSKGIPTFSNVSTTNEGMYAAEDDLGTSYYFRGAVNNNWVKFGKDSSGNYMYWRIIRINGDGSIRMIYSGTTTPTSSTATVMTGTGTQIGTSAFNSSYNNPAYVGYMYTASMQHGNSTASTIKTYLDNWYKKTTLETDTSTKKLVADEIFCNDRSASTSSSGNYGEISGNLNSSSRYYYGSYGRIYGNKENPTLICPTESDIFSVKTSTTGNKKLDYPVGLITTDELIFAGGIYGKQIKTYYLYVGLSYWTVSPAYFASGSSMHIAYYDGDIDTNTLQNAQSVRPVISLSSKAKLTGNGTYNNVYEVIS